MEVGDGVIVGVVVFGAVGVDVGTAVSVAGIEVNVMVADGRLVTTAVWIATVVAAGVSTFWQPINKRIDNRSGIIFSTAERFNISKLYLTCPNVRCERSQVLIRLI